MPAKPSYFHRLGDAVEVLRGLQTEWIDRRTLEEVLGVSKTVAWRVMHRCGAGDGPGNALMCRRDDLVRALSALQSTGEFEREVRRRARLSEYLERMAEIGLSRRTAVADRQEALDLVNARFGHLPTGVSLTTRQLTVDFNTPEEFLQRIGAVVFALQNDYEAIREFIETGVRSRR